MKPVEPHPRPKRLTRAIPFSVLVQLSIIDKLKTGWYGMCTAAAVYVAPTLSSLGTLPRFFVFRKVGAEKGSSQAGLEGRTTGRVERAATVHGVCVAVQQV